MRTSWIRYIAGAVVLVGVGLLGGCKPADTASNGAAAPNVPAKPKIDYGDVPGLPVDMPTDTTKLKGLYARQDVRPRRDPFSLSPQEMAFDREQTSERLLQEQGNMETMYVEPPAPDDKPPLTEPQPYRRVSGILVGDSVVAIIEMGGGGPPEIVRPGQFVGQTGWWVVSIDEEIVVLRRAGSVQPKELRIRLEQRPPGMGGGSAAPGGGGAPSVGPGGGGAPSVGPSGAGGGAATTLGG